MIHTKLTKLSILILMFIVIGCNLNQSNNKNIPVIKDKTPYISFPMTIEDVQLKLPADFEFISKDILKSGDFKGFTKYIYHGNNKLPRVEIIADKNKIYCFNRLSDPEIELDDLQMGNISVSPIALANFVDVEMLTGNKYLETMDKSDIQTFMLTAKACWTNIKDRTSKREKYSLGDTVILLSNVLSGIQVSYMTVDTWKVIRSKELKTLSK